MQLRVKELSKLLNISERTVYRWIKQESIPFYRIHDQYRFDRVEILEWATVQKVNVSQGIVNDNVRNDELELSLAETIKNGGIYYRIEGRDKKSVLGSAVSLLNLPDNVDKQRLLNAMILREELSPTGFGDGIAIPHARYPVATHIPNSLISICFLEEPIDFGSIDGKLVHCLFTMVSPSVRTHLQMLSRIAFVLSDVKVKNVITNQSSREIIYEEIARAEQCFKNKELVA